MATPPAREPDDVVLVHGVTEDGDGLRVIRRRREQLETGEVRGVREGQPLHGDLVKLRPRDDHPLLFDVDVQYEAETAPTGARKGPPKVSTAPYRDGWDAIWGEDEPTRDVPN